MPRLTLDDLVRNGTMGPEAAALLSAAAAECRSFMVVARPRLAGKTTIMDATLEHAPPAVAVHALARSAGPGLGIPTTAARGYLRLSEIAQVGFDDYFWGAETQRVFEALGQGFSLATALHADSLDEAFAVLAANGLSEASQSRLDLVALVRVLGHWTAPERRVLAELHEVHAVQDGRVHARLLQRWDADADRFELLSSPEVIGSTTGDLEARTKVFRRVRESGAPS